MAEVLIADDSEFMRNLLRGILEGDHTIVREVENGVEEKMKGAVKAGADGYITKPFQKPSVMEAIQDVVPS